MTERKLQPVTLGPVNDQEADALVKDYRRQGYTAKKSPRPGREGQFMVEIRPKE